MTNRTLTRKTIKRKHLLGALFVLNAGQDKEASNPVPTPLRLTLNEYTHQKPPKLKECRVALYPYVSCVPR